MPRPVFDRFPGLDRRVRCVELATLPTRVHRLAAVSARTGAEVWIKRDDESHALHGGSKIRALEFLLDDLRRGVQPVIACGPEASGWLLGLVRFGVPIGIDARIVTFPQPDTPESRHKADLLRRHAGARLTAARDLPEFLVRMLHAAIRIVGDSARAAPAGGSSALSTLGYVSAALELAGQILDGQCPKPDAIYVPAGSCGLAAGLALGLAVAGLDCELVAVSIAPRLLSNKTAVIRLLLQTAWVLDLRSPVMAPTRMTHRFKGAYAAPTAAGLAARSLFAEDGVDLDPVYTAKTGAALLSEARPGRTFLYWHTYNRPG